MQHSDHFTDREWVDFDPGRPATVSPSNDHSLSASSPTSSSNPISPQNENPPAVGISLADELITLDPLTALNGNGILTGKPILNGTGPQHGGEDGSTGFAQQTNGGNESEMGNLVTF